MKPRRLPREVICRGVYVPLYCPLNLTYVQRTDERRRLNWTGVGPVRAEVAGRDLVTGFAAHAGKHLAVVDWATFAFRRRLAHREAP